MNIDEMRKAIAERFPDAAFQFDETGKTGTVWSVLLPLSGIRDAAAAFEKAGFFLETVTALDFEDTRELVYHFNLYRERSRVAVRVLCGQDDVPESISDIFRGAGWLEREIHEFFGIAFAGNPDMRPLLLPEDADYHPLLKSFGKTGAYHKREKIHG